MELIRGAYNLRPGHRGGIATIGNFDGIHLGHQHVLKQLIDQAAARDLPSAVVLFEPLPREFFQGEHAPGRLTRLREKLEVLKDTPIERLVCLRFDQHLASMRPETFIREILVEGLGIERLVVGDDFRFGRGREGDFEMLVGAGKEQGFTVVRTESYELQGERVSSTAVRQALDIGDLAAAARLLGHPYFLCGRVSHGDRLGRGIGYPTINIPLRRWVTPVGGVFVVRVHGLDAMPLQGIANIGKRPIVNGSRVQLEVFIFDFDRTVYGKLVRVELLHWLRAETPFDSFEAMRQQIDRDAQAARQWLRRT